MATRIYTLVKFKENVKGEQVHLGTYKTEKKKENKKNETASYKSHTAFQTLEENQWDP